MRYPEKKGLVSWNFLEINIDIGAKLMLTYPLSYVLLSLYFLDLDECSFSNGGCHEHSICDNTESSFTCTCLSEYTGDGLNCFGM